MTRPQSPPLVRSQTHAQNDVTEAITRCVETLADLEALRLEVQVLRMHSSPLAHFAAALFDLDRARRGDAEARLGMLETADTLLTFWQAGTGDELVGENPTLTKLWSEAGELLQAFELKRFKQALAACWEVRENAEALADSIAGLVPDGNRRVEFARCLYHLELARLGVTSSRGEFARRAGLLSEAYQSDVMADELVGNDSGLNHLWLELKPYLDEFFEMMEEEATARAKTDPLRTAVPRPEVTVTTPIPVESQNELPPIRRRTPQHLPPPVPPPVLLPVETEQEGSASVFSRDSDIVDPTELEAAEVEAIEPLEATHVGPPPPPVPGPPAPPKPPDLTPPGSWVPEAEVDFVEIVEARPAAPKPKTRKPAPSLDVVLDDGYVPDEPTLAFWKHTFAQLDLLPDPKEQRVARRLLSAESRGERARLNDFLGTLPDHGTVPEARAFGAMVRLLMGGQLKEKSLFGSPNARRAEAFQQAFAWLSGDPLAAAHAAVWFQLDGAKTEEALQRGLDVLMKFLAWCLRENRSPTDPDAHKAFFKA